MNKQQRKVWLQKLTKLQLMALGCQRKVENWQKLDRNKLVMALSVFKDIDEPEKV